jgi:hypothetical protein
MGRTCCGLAGQAAKPVTVRNPPKQENPPQLLTFSVLLPT